MIKQIIAGDMVQYIADGAINQSIVRKISQDGKYVYIDYFEGKDMIHRKEQPVLINNVTLI